MIKTLGSQYQLFQSGIAGEAASLSGTRFAGKNSEAVFFNNHVKGLAIALASQHGFRAGKR